MSYFPPGGGAGGGWPPPFFTQPPPPVQQMQYFIDPSQTQGYPVGVGMQPDYQQQGYNPYAQMPAPVPVPPPPVPLPPEPSPQTPATKSKSKGKPKQVGVQQQHLQELPAQEIAALSMPQTARHVEREQRRSEYKSSRDHRDSPEPDRRLYRDNDGDSVERKYARRNRSPGDEQVYRQHTSDDRGRQRDRGRPHMPSGSPQPHSPQSKPKVDIDALLQDERLRNVLFAGISKATAKLEQSLQDGKERSDFEPQEAKSQVFPSASSSQKPRSILKRKDGDDSGSSKALSNLSALERTLHLLRGKGDVAAEASLPDSRSTPEHKSPPPHGALSKLSAYDEGEEDDSHRYKRKDKDSSASVSKPFWSVPSKLEASKRESDAFDAKEKMFEEWRQSIGKPSDKKASSKVEQRVSMLRSEESVPYKQSSKRKEMTVPSASEEREADNQEELDSTVQNILQSIGFNFDLSKRMQELARKKRMQEDGSSGIRNVSASFLDKGDLLAEELKASLLRSGSDLSSIDNLLKEARASSQSSRRGTRVARSPSPDQRGGSYGREVRDQSPPSSRHEYEYERSSRDEHYGKPKFNYGKPSAEQWDRESPQASPPRKHYREEVPLSPREKYVEPVRQSGPPMSERFKIDEGDRIEYFYPDKDYSEPPPSVPLLTSLSSRKWDEDLTGGLLKTLRVENLRVMSRPTDDDPEGDAYREMRRVILPAKSDRDPSRSPSRTVLRKRSASPLAMRVSKERKISPSYYDDYPRRRSPGGRSSEAPSKETPRRKSPSPKYRTPARRDISLSPRRRRSRSRTRSRSPYRRKSPPRRRSRSPRRRSRSPRRRTPPRGKRGPSPSYRSRRTPPRRGGRSRSRSADRNSSKTKPADTASSRNRQSSTDSRNRPDTSKKDISKLPEKERKTELKKLMLGIGTTGDKGKASEEEDKKASRVAAIIGDLTSLSKVQPVIVTQLTTEILLLGDEQQQSTLDNVATRKTKVSALKTDLERLRKAQNELMRKSQRSGLGNKDPHLKANNLSQMETEKEIDRLSAPELTVSLVSNFDKNMKGIQSKLDKEVANSKAKAKSQAKNKESEAKGSKSDTKATIANAMEPTEKNSNWTSVKVEDADLPDIGVTKGGGKKKEKPRPTPAKPKKDVYYEYIDSKNHWCSHCHINLNALDQYFSHLHGKKHFGAINEVPKPWDEFQGKRARNKGKVGKAQTRRIKGSELLFPVAGFYCKLCSIYCGDFFVADKHLKSDDHYDKYLDFVRDNPSYEKQLLLEKTSGKGKRQPDVSVEKYTKAMPAPLPTSGKKGKKNKSLRQKRQEEEKDAANSKDNLEPVDMELDDNSEAGASKVPKMAARFANSVACLLSSLPEAGASSTSVEMKSNKEDEVKSLDKFLTIASNTSEPEKKTKSKAKKKKKSEKIPVIGAKDELDLMNIPIPEPPKLTAIPLPPGDRNIVPSTVKTLKEVEDEEKRMMGIDVDADEEKPLAPVKPPPPLSETSKKSSNQAVNKTDEKPKKLDSLLSKVSKPVTGSSSKKVKSQSVAASEEDELEKQIKQGIQEKVEKEKQKMIKLQEQKERREKKLEEKKKLKKKKVISDSSSSSEEDTDVEDDEDQGTTEVKMETGSDIINLENFSLPTTDSASTGCSLTAFCKNEDDNQNPLNSLGVSVKEEVESQEVVKQGTDKMDVKIEKKMEVHTENVSKAEDVDNATKSKTESLDVDDVVLDITSGIKMEIDAEGTCRESSQSTPLQDDSNRSEIEKAGDISSLDEPGKQVMGAGDKSDNVSEEMDKTIDDSSSPSGSIDAPKMDGSGKQSIKNKKSSMPKQKTPTSVGSKGPGKKTLPLTKTAVVKALQSESDLLQLQALKDFTETPKKDQGPRRAVARRGGKSGNTTFRKIPESSTKGKDENTTMDVSVVQSESKEEENVPMTESEVSNVSLQNAGEDTVILSNNEEDTTAKVDEQVEMEIVNPVAATSNEQQLKGVKNPTKGRSKGKKAGVKKETPVVPETQTSETTGGEKNDESVTKVEKELSPSPVVENIVDSTEVVSTALSVEMEEVEEVAPQAVNRNRRGRSATAKATPTRTVKQTRARGKKKDVELESQIVKEESKNSDVGVGETEGGSSREDGTKSELGALQQSESLNTEETSSSVSEITEESSRQSKNGTEMVTDSAVESIGIQSEGETRNGGPAEEIPSVQGEKETTENEVPKSSSLCSGETKKSVSDDVSEEEKVKSDANDSDATVTEETEDLDSVEQASPSAEAVTQSGSKMLSQNPTSLELSPSDPQLLTDPLMDTSDQSEMPAEKEQVPVASAFSETANLPTDNSTLDQDDESMEFPFSMEGFTVLDVEGQPDEDGGQGDDDDGDLLLS